MTPLRIAIGVAGVSSFAAVAYTLVNTPNYGF